MLSHLKEISFSKKCIIHFKERLNFYENENNKKAFSSLLLEQYNQI